MPVVIKRSTPVATKTIATEPSEVLKFSVMLAASEIPTEDQIAPRVSSYYASFKFDGIRTAITGGVAMSRKMLPLPNQFIQAWAKKYENYLQGFDGEIIVGPPNATTTFNTTTSGVMSADGEPDFYLYVFDMWDMESSTAAQRYEFLQAIIPDLPEEVRSRIKLVKQFRPKNMVELKAYYAEALALGYEGLILKAINLVYKFGRSTLLEGYLLKWKEFIDYTCMILEVKQGKKNTNEKVRDELGRAKRSTAKAGKVPVEEVGGFVVKCIEPESVYYDMQFNCGPGSLTQAELKRLWAIRDSLVSLPIKVKSQKLGGKTLPRFPSWYAWLHEIDMGNPE